MQKFRFSWNSLYILIGINLVLFAIPTLGTLLLGSRVDNIYGLSLSLLGGLRPDLVADGEWWRIVTSTFLHADFLHLLANMYGLWQIGMIVKNYYGNRFLWSSYIITGVMGSVFSIIFLPNTATVGASGAVFGLMGVLLGATFRRSRFGVELPFGTTDILPLALYAFAAVFLPGFAVNNWAHLGGFVAGIALGWLLPHKLSHQSRSELRVEQGLTYATVVVFGLCYILMVSAVYSALFISVI